MFQAHRQGLGRSILRYRVERETYTGLFSACPSGMDVVQMIGAGDYVGSENERLPHIREGDQTARISNTQQ